MKLTLSGQINKKIAKAVVEFNMLEDGDRVLVGFSGGKDSFFLLYALAVLQGNVSIDYKLSALTIDPGFDNRSDFTELANICSELGVSYHVKETEIGSYIINEEVKNPCASCSYLRKGAIVNFMNKNGFNKLAYGHHYDDAVETFLLSIIYSGQIKTFPPMRYLPGKDVHIIRPLVYLREKRITEAVSRMNFNPIKSLCPFEEETKRKDIKQLLDRLTFDKQIFYNLAAAMREGTEIELWPERNSRQEIVRGLKKFWKQ